MPVANVVVSVNAVPPVALMYHFNDLAVGKFATVAPLHNDCTAIVGAAVVQTASIILIKLLQPVAALYRPLVPAGTVNATFAKGTFRKTFGSIAKGVVQLTTTDVKLVQPKKA